MTVSVLLLIVAVLLFLVAGLVLATTLSGVSAAALVAFGLAAFAAAHLPI